MRAVPNPLLEYAEADEQLDTGLNTELEASAAPKAGLEQRLSFKDRYELLGFIGSGGQGQVYKVRDTETGNILAAKRIFLGNWENAEVLRNEARSLQNLNHSGIPKYHECYVQKDLTWGSPEYVLVTEYVEGESLFEKLKNGRRFDEKELHDIKAQVLDALSAAHKKGIVHRDIKPANIMLDQQGNVRVTDFGIAKFLGEKTKTRTLGAGSIEYMAPEQKRGEKIVPETDYYGLGMTLIALASGRDLAFDDDPHQLLENVTYLSKPFRESLQSMISENPEKRRDGLIEKVVEVAKVEKTSGYELDREQKVHLDIKNKIKIKLPELYTVAEQIRFASFANIARHVKENQGGGLTAFNIAHTVGGVQGAGVQGAGFTAFNIAHTVGRDQVAGLTAFNIAHTVGEDQWAVLTAANIAHTVGGAQVAGLTAFNIAHTVGGEQGAFITAANIAHTVGGVQVAGFTAANIAHTVGGNQVAILTAANIAHTVGGDQFSIIPTINIAGTVGGNQFNIVNIAYQKIERNQYGIINYARDLSEQSKQYGLINLRAKHSKKRWSSGPERWWNPEISLGYGRKKWMNFCL